MSLKAVADRGYFNGEEILDFVYLPQEDVYRCPAGERLKYYYTNVENGLKLRRRSPETPALRPQVS
jgi:hypothetical protein